MPADSLSQIVEMQRAVAEAGLDLERVMGVIAARAPLLTGAHGSTVELVEGTDSVVRAGCCDGAGTEGVRLRLASSLSGQAVRTGRAQRCDDAETDEVVSQAAARVLGARSLLVVPLSAGGEVVGVLKVFSREPAAFTAAQVHTLEIMAAHLGAAIQGAWQYRELQTERSRLSALLEQAPAFIATLQGPEHVFERANARYYALVGQRDLLGRPAREALPELEGQPYFGLLDEVYRTGRPYVGREMPIAVQRGADGAEERFVDFVFQPVREADGTVSGVFVHGVDVTEPVRDRLRVEHLAAERAVILSQIGDGVMMADREGRVVYVNEPAARLCGPCDDAEHGYGLHHLDGTPMALHEVPLTRAAVDGVSVTDELVRVRREGADDRIVEATARPIASEHGERLGAVLTLRDVTERLRAETELRESRARLQRMAGNVPGMMFQVAMHPDGTWTWPFVGAGSRLIYECAPERLHANPALPFESVHPEDAEDMRRSIARSAETLEPWDWHGRVVVPSGVKWIHGASRPQRLDDGTVVWDGLLIDISDRQRAADEIRFQAHLLDSVQEAVIATDLKGTVLFWNRFAEKLYGWTAAEALGRDVLDLIPAEGARDDAAAVMQQLQAGGTWSGELRMRRKDGTRFPAHVTDAPIRDAAGRVVGLVGASSDLTDRKRLEEQLLQSQKMEAVGRLAGGVAHDFNNLLTVIQGGADLMLMEMDDAHALREDTLEIRRAAVRAAGLTRQLLAFSRRQVLQPRVMDLNATVRDLESMLRRLIGEDVEVAADLAPELRPVRADPGQVEQVIMNLAVNARDAMPRGGTITLATRDVVLTHAQARGGRFSIPAGRYVCVSVADTGTGIAAEHLPHVFEPFFTTKEVGKGTGLGLSTAYGIVRQSGGYVWAESAPGAGTTFRVYLPALEREPVAEPEGEAASAPVPYRGRATVLVVEDEEGVRRVAHRILEGAGYRVLLAESGEDALAVLEAHGEPVDLVLSDVVMPGMGGPELVHRLTTGTRVAPRVLYMSGHTHDALAHRGPLGAATALIEKPFPHDLLLRRVREALEG
jgi:two-component system cell cycle sensor histidine kinase/response regulator CckA